MKRTFDVTIRIQVETNTVWQAEGLVETLGANHMREMLDCPQVLAAGLIDVKEVSRGLLNERTRP